MIEDITQTDRGLDTHPAFGVIQINNPRGTPRSLFQTDLQHGETITLTIAHAERERNLRRDWVFARNEIIEVEMSLAQWANVVSSSGRGSGTPVTIRHIENESTPSIPHEPRLKKAWDEVEGTIEALLEDVKKAFNHLQEIGLKAGIVERRAAMSALETAIRHVSGNATFAVSSLAEAAEGTVEQAKSDLEAFVVQIAAQNNLDAAQISSFNSEVLAVEAGSK